MFTACSTRPSSEKADLSGVWCLTRRDFPYGGVQTWDIASKEVRLREYYGDTVFHEMDILRDSSGIVIAPGRRSYYTNIYLGNDTYSYYEERSPRPLHRSGDSVIVIQENGIQNTWVRYTLSGRQRELIRRALSMQQRGTGCKYYIISTEETRLRQQTDTLLHALVIVIMLLAFITWQAVLTYRRKRHTEVLLRGIMEESRLRPAPVNDALRGVEQQFRQSEYYHTVHRRIARRERFVDDDWREMERQIKSVYPSLLRNLTSLCHLSEVEWRTCMLVRMDVSPSDMAELLHRDTSSISTIRSRLYKKVFGRKGSSRQWDDFILSL